MDRTFVMVKPDGVQRGLVGEIVGRLESKGLKLVAARFESLPEARVTGSTGTALETVLPLPQTVYYGRPLFPDGLGRKKRCCHRPQGCRCDEPAGSAPGTIRGDFGSISAEM